MSAIDDLLNQITDKTLRERIGAEIRKNEKSRKFGLVFENHLPEYTFLNEFNISVGRLVIQKNEKSNILYEVQKIEDNMAICRRKHSDDIFYFPVESLEVVAEFGEPIYPYLMPVDSVCNAPDSDLWHTLIESDNYHALQLLNYLYAGKVDCIYIDPPYNTGAKDWKYNNNYVDSNDAYRHSKWLSMMEKRVKLAKKLLKPDIGVLIVTIDEHEVHHLRTLLEQIFPEFYIQMTTDVINPKGVTQGRFSRVEEYNIFCFAQNAFIDKSNDNLLNPINLSRKPRWKGLLRSGEDSLRSDCPRLFYPVLIDRNTKKIICACHYLPLSEQPMIDEQIDGYDVAWPIRSDGNLGRWGVGNEKLNDLIAKGYVACGRYDKIRRTYGISYISEENQKLIENDGIIITGRNEITNVVNIEFSSDDTRVIKSVWHRKEHDAGAYGTTLLSNILGTSRSFSFPKSLHSTKDAIASVMRSRKNALILDFFAGSGTTLHAVNLLNAEDGGKRRCILVTNNEVSDKESADMLNQGLMPGSPQWEAAGICRSVTWPRTVNSIMGKRANGTVLSGEYFTTLTVENKKTRNIIQFPVLGDCTGTRQNNLLGDGGSNGAVFSIQQKKQIVAILDKIPQSAVTNESDYIVNEEYPAAVLFNIAKSDEFLDALQENDHVADIYIVTGDNRAFKQLKERINAEIGDITVKEPFMLPMSDGFKANVAYFKLGFLDKLSVALGKQFAALLPLLWLKAGGRGICPKIDTDALSAFYIFVENAFAVLVDEKDFNTFKKELSQYPAIDVVYLITDSEFAYRDMKDRLAVMRTIQLYSDYLDNFRINQV